MERLSPRISRLSLIVTASLLTLLALALGSCGDSTQKCTSDDQCSQGYTCYEGAPYDGECIQRIAVIPCGGGYCQYGYEQCADDICVPAGQPDTDAGGGGGAGGGGMNTPDMGGQGGFGGEGGFADPDMGPPAVRPTVVIEAPFSNQVFLETQSPELFGQIQDLEPSADVRLLIDSDPQGFSLTVDEAGQFRAPLRVGPGDHIVRVRASQQGLTGEAEVSFRIDGYVTARGNQFKLGDRTFKVIAVNAPGLLADALAVTRDGAEDRVESFFTRAKALGVNTVRVPAYDDRPDSPTVIQRSPGEYNEEGFVALDHIIAMASKHGIKLLLPLIGPDSRGGVLQYLKWGGYLVPVAADRRRFFLDGPVRELFKNHIRAMAARSNTFTGRSYAESPAIMAWEIFDAVDGAGVFQANTGAEANAFFEELARVLHGNDSNHMVATGDIGWDINPDVYRDQATPFQNAGLGPLLDGTHAIAWQQNMRLNGIDFATIQLDTARLGFPVSANDFSNLGAAWIRGHAALSTVASRPLLVTQAKMPRAQLPLADRRAVYSAWFDEILSLNLPGMAIGNMYANGSDASGDPSAFFWNEGTEPVDPVNEYADQLQTFSDELLEGAF